MPLAIDLTAILFDNDLLDSSLRSLKIRLVDIGHLETQKKSHPEASDGVFDAWFLVLISRPDGTVLTIGSS
jgi:hypothetical protein